MLSGHELKRNISLISSENSDNRNSILHYYKSSINSRIVRTAVESILSNL